MSITLNLPADLEARLRSNVPDLDKRANEAVALELYRKEKITHYELSQMLGLDRFATDAFLKERGEFAQCLSFEEIEQDRRTLRDAIRESGQ